MKDMECFSLPASLVKVKDGTNPFETSSGKKELYVFCRTSMRNFGLSGMNSLMMKADERLGMEQRTTNNLQL